MKGICLQLGLHTTAEYLYLTDDDWKQSMLDRHEVLHIPDSVTEDIGKWQYYGVDANFYSIEYMAREHEDKGNWLAAKVVNRTGMHFQENDSQLNRRFSPHKGVYVPAITLPECVYQVWIRKSRCACNGHRELGTHCA